MAFGKWLTLFIIGASLFLVLGTKEVKAVQFDLIAPTGTLHRGGDATFTINVNTQGDSLTQTSVGMTYDKTVLQYKTVVPGNTFSNISITPQNDGSLLVSGSNSAPFSGSGKFADVTFTIIADSPGSTQLCTLITPPSPTSPPSGTPGPTNNPSITSIPPTALPKTGSTDQTVNGGLIGALLLVVTGVLFVATRI